ncbi:MAG: AAA family ATPase, partial [Pseudomonadales bacterium]|nr:AAA family ATPase [Pseudomonadales bacterium]
MLELGRVSETKKSNWGIQVNTEKKDYPQNYLDWLTNSEHDLPGTVTGTNDHKDIFIKCEIAQPLIEQGKEIEKFYISGQRHEIEKPETGQHITFKWNRPGTKSERRDCDNALANNPKIIDENEYLKRVDELSLLKEVFKITGKKPETKKTNDFSKLKLLSSNNIDGKVNELIARLTEINSGEKKPEEELIKLILSPYSYVSECLRAISDPESENKIKKNNKLAKAIKDKENQLKEKQKEIDKANSTLCKVSPYLAQLVTKENEANSNTKPSLTLKETAELWDKKAAITEDELLKKSVFLCSLASALCGSFTLLHGPVGVGKTSGVRRLANIIGSKKFSLIPTRPAWIEPADILGYFDPLESIFRPGPLTTEMPFWQREDKDIHLCCFDEMNLARVENYLSDVLSILERESSSDLKSTRTLHLYSETEFAALSYEYEKLAEAQAQAQAQASDLSIKDAARLEKLKAIIGNFPNKFPLPNGLSLFGTLNADESTMDLSPKLIDRSFSIRFPKASKKELQRELQVNEEATKSSSDCLHYTTLVDEVKKKLDEKKEDYEKAWGDLLNELYKLDFDNIGLPLSHRLRRDFMVLSALVSACGFDENCTKDVF